MHSKSPKEIQQLLDIHHRMANSQTVTEEERMLLEKALSGGQLGSQGMHAIIDEWAKNVTTHMASHLPGDPKGNHHWTPSPVYPALPPQNPGGWPPATPPYPFPPPQGPYDTDARKRSVELVREVEELKKALTNLRIENSVLKSQLEGFKAEKNRTVSELARAGDPSAQADYVHRELNQIVDLLLDFPQKYFDRPGFIEMIRHYIDVTAETLRGSKEQEGARLGVACARDIASVFNMIAKDIVWINNQHEVSRADHLSLQIAVNQVLVEICKTLGVAERDHHQARRVWGGFVEHAKSTKEHLAELLKDLQNPDLEATEDNG